MLLFISILVSLVVGWFSHWLFNRVRLVIQSRRLVIVAPGESGIERYQRQKEAIRALKPIDPPPGANPEAAERFKKLSPQDQHRAIEAIKRLRLDG